MAESPLVLAARDWVVDNYPYNREHLLRSLDWLDRIAPGAPEAVRIAALTHDMERAFPGADSPPMTTLDDDEYIRRHSERSARIVCEWLKNQGAPAALRDEVEELVLAHEIGGRPEADLVQAADSLSFLDTNVDLFLGFVRGGRFGPDAVRWKFQHTFDRIRVANAKRLARGMLDAAFAKLAALEHELGVSSAMAAAESEQPMASGPTAER